MRKHWMMGLSVVALLGGCLETIEPPEQNTTDPDPVDPADPTDPDPTDPDPTDPTDPTDPIDPTDPLDPVDPTDPVDPGAITWCLPRAVSAVPSLNLPEIPPEALDPVCALVKESVDDPQPYGSSANVRYYHREDGLWVRFANNYYANLLHVVLDGGVRVEARYGMRFPGDDLRFDFREPIHRSTWDRDGNLLQTSTITGEVEEVHMTQTWQDGRLVARTEVRNGWVDDQVQLETLATTWHYDAAGRLAGATATGFGHVWRVAWGYDAHGRPVSVERLRDGVQIELRTWSYDAEGRVAHRTIREDRSHYSNDGWSPSTLDDMGSMPSYDWNSNPWPHALPVEDAARGCAHLPKSMGHGYPAGEPEYELGMPVEDRPSGIGWAYGANTYGWDYGDLSWYSHGGIHALSLEDRGVERFEATITYEGGRMVRESLTDDSSWSARASERVRTFIDGHLTTDRLDIDLTYAPSTNDDTVVERSLGRELRFERSAAGGVVRRELRDDVYGLLEYQLWWRDDADRWIAHEISQPTSIASIPDYWYGGDCQDCVHTEPVIWRRYERELDDAGRKVVMREMYVAPGNEGYSSETRWTYDALGRVVARMQGTTTEMWDFDAEGRVVRQGWDMDGDGLLDQWEDTTWDARGRWTKRQYFYGPEQPGRAILREFACD